MWSNLKKLVYNKFNNYLAYALNLNSKSINSINYTNLNSSAAGESSTQLINNINEKLNPWWVTGFCDAEASFTVSLIKSETASIGWTAAPCFIITLHIKDLKLLESIKNFFNDIVAAGASINIVENFAHYRVRSRKDLSIIISHFNNYPLCSAYALSFLIFLFLLIFMI